MEVLLIVVLLVIIFLIWNFSSGPWEHMDRLTNKSLAQKLGDAGWTLYKRDGCHFCTKQLAEFNGNTKGLPIIDCNKNPEKCFGVQGVPTWINSKTGKKTSGYKDKAGLAALLV